MATIESRFAAWLEQRCRDDENPWGVKKHELLLREAFEAGAATMPSGVLNVNARMREPQQPVALNEAQQHIAAWLKEHGFIEDRYVLAKCWSTREGIDFTDLEFYPWANDKYPARFSAIIGHHASGTNPRTIIGTCDTLADVQMVCETIRLINGYNAPEPWHLEDSVAAGPSLGDCVSCDNYVLNASEFPHCPTCARLIREGKPL